MIPMILGLLKVSNGAVGVSTTTLAIQGRYFAAAAALPALAMSGIYARRYSVRQRGKRAEGRE
jgi:hypothetical protein